MSYKLVKGKYCTCGEKTHSKKLKCFKIKTLLFRQLFNDETLVSLESLMTIKAGLTD
jgi:hypothetical protein